MSVSLYIFSLSPPSLTLPPYLTLPPSRLLPSPPQTTDICEHALQALSESSIRRVLLVGHHGPLQVTFTTNALREMTKLTGFHICIHPADFNDAKNQLSGQYCLRSQVIKRPCAIFLRAALVEEVGQ